MQETKFKETEIGLIPEDWKLRGLGSSIVSIKTGKLNSNAEVKKGKYLFFTCAPKPLKTNTYSFNQKAILLAGNNANGIFHLNYYEGKFDVYQRTYVMTEVEGFDLKFIYYALKPVLSHFREISQGSATKFLTIKILNELQLPIPASLNEQKAIAEILFDLDSKIKILQQQNNTLEKIGNIIFKHWFVDFEFPNKEGKPYKSSGGEMVKNELGETPSSWKNEKLQDYVNQISGCSYASKDLKESDNALVTLKSISRVGEFKKKGFKEYSGKYKDAQVVNDGDIVVAHTDLTQNVEVLGTPVIVRDYNIYTKMIASLDLVIVRPKEKLNRVYLYNLLKMNDFHNHAISYSNGTTVIHLSKKAIPNYEFKLPDSRVLSLFEDKLDVFLKSAKNNTLEIESLRKNRDLLLPKLMSGKIRVVLK